MAINIKYFEINLFFEIFVAQKLMFLRRMTHIYMYI